MKEPVNLIPSKSDSLNAIYSLIDNTKTKLDLIHSRY